MLSFPFRILFENRVTMFIVHVLIFQ